MKNSKFGADLGGQGGHIILTDSSFIYQTIFGETPIIIPVSDIIGYKKRGLHIVIVIAGMETQPLFYTWRGDAIIKALKMRNPQIEERNDYNIPVAANLMSYILIAFGIILGMLGLYILIRIILSVVMNFT